jgi:hypothetical protein
MLTEYVQQLSTCLNYYGLDAPYKSTHLNHPCCKWVRDSLGNYQFLWRLADYLGEEYSLRYEKEHLAHTKLKLYVPYTPDVKFPKKRFYCPPNVTSIKGKDSIVDTYRECYMTTKRHLAKWKYRPVPGWFV